MQTTTGDMFSFTKLLVHDLEAAGRFYASVCGLVEHERVDAEIEGRAIREILYKPAYEGGASFVLLKFLDAPKPFQGEVILGFVTNDIEAFVDRAQTAGGRLVEPPYVRIEHGIKVAFLRDPEDHLIEVVQMLGEPQT